MILKSGSYLSHFPTSLLHVLSSCVFTLTVRTDDPLEKKRHLLLCLTPGWRTQFNVSLKDDPCQTHWASSIPVFIKMSTDSFLVNVGTLVHNNKTHTGTYLRRLKTEDKGYYLEGGGVGVVVGVPFYLLSPRSL